MRVGWTHCPALGATATACLDGDGEDLADRLGGVAGDVDVVIDYLWGEPTVAAMHAILTNRADRGKPLDLDRDWIGRRSDAAIPSALLPTTRIQIVGSGQGSVSGQGFLAELPALAEEITAAIRYRRPGDSACRRRLRMGFGRRSDTTHCPHALVTTEPSARRRTTGGVWSP